MRTQCTETGKGAGKTGGVVLNLELFEIDCDSLGFIGTSDPLLSERLRRPRQLDQHKKYHVTSFHLHSLCSPGHQHNNLYFWTSCWERLTYCLTRLVSSVFSCGFNSGLAK